MFNFMLPSRRANFVEVLAPDKSLSGPAVDPRKEREVGRFFKKKLGLELCYLTFVLAAICVILYSILYKSCISNHFLDVCLFISSYSYNYSFVKPDSEVSRAGGQNERASVPGRKCHCSLCIHVQTGPPVGTKISFLADKAARA
jgi:hypothetical protein